MPTLLLDKNAIQSLLKMSDVINVVEEAFRAWAEGRANMPPKAYLLVEHGDFRAMPAILPGCAGVKWVNCHPFNASHSLPTVGGFTEEVPWFGARILVGAQVRWCFVARHGHQ